MKNRRTRDVLLLAVLLAADAGAHGLHQAGGTVTVDEKRATVVLRLDGEHGPAAPWADGLVLRDGTGERLLLRVLSREADLSHAKKVVELAADLPGRPRHLAFQLVPAAADSVRRRLVLTVRSTGLDGERQVTLTNGGNVEVVTFAWDPTDTLEPDACGLDTAGRTVRGVLRRDGEDLEDLRLDVVLPIALLETWQPLARRAADWLETSEQEAVRPRLLDLAANAWALHVEGEVRRPDATDVAFVGLDDGAFEEPSARVSTWTGSVRLTARWKAAASADELEWNFWNAAVLTADVAVADGDESVRCRWRTLSTYAPRLTLAGPDVY